MKPANEMQESDLKTLLKLGTRRANEGEQRQQNIIQGVRWLATLQALTRLYLEILPKAVINIFAKFARRK